MDKIKITKKELDDLYDVEEDPKEELVEDSNATVTFEDYSISKDKEDNKKWRLEDL